MGKLSSGIFGGVSGKVGNLTGSSWKGIQVVKSRPQSVAYPGTSGQVAQTTKMSAIVSFCKPILSSWIKPLWDRSAVKMSGYNAFVQANIAEFADGVIDDYSTLIMSRGTMEATPISSVDMAAGGASITVKWNPSAISGLQLATDLAYAMFIYPAREEVVVGTPVARSVGQIVLPSIEGLNELDYPYCYLAFKRANGTIISNSSYNHVE